MLFSDDMKRDAIDQEDGTGAICSDAQENERSRPQTSSYQMSSFTYSSTADDEEETKDEVHVDGDTKANKQKPTHVIYGLDVADMEYAFGVKLNEVPRFDAELVRAPMNDEQREDVRPPSREPNRKDETEREATTTTTTALRIGFSCSRFQSATQSLACILAGVVGLSLIAAVVTSLCVATGLWTMPVAMTGHDAQMLTYASHDNNRTTSDTPVSVAYADGVARYSDYVRTEYFETHGGLPSGEAAFQWTSFVAWTLLWGCVPVLTILPVVKISNRRTAALFTTLFVAIMACKATFSAIVCVNGYFDDGDVELQGNIVLSILWWAQLGTLPLFAAIVVSSTSVKREYDRGVFVWHVIVPTIVALVLSPTLMSRTLFAYYTSISEIPRVALSAVGCICFVTCARYLLHVAITNLHHRKAYRTILRRTSGNVAVFSFTVAFYDRIFLALLAPWTRDVSYGPFLVASVCNAAIRTLVCVERQNLDRLITACTLTITSGHERSWFRDVIVLRRVKMTGNRRWSKRKESVRRDLRDAMLTSHFFDLFHSIFVPALLAIVTFWLRDRHDAGSVVTTALVTSLLLLTPAALGTLVVLYYHKVTYALTTRTVMFGSSTMGIALLVSVAPAFVHVALWQIAFVLANPLFG